MNNINYLTFKTSSGLCPVSPLVQRLHAAFNYRSRQVDVVQVHHNIDDCKYNRMIGDT